jgi:predicted anti-sigma-YlaC factor YlaD
MIKGKKMKCSEIYDDLFLFAEDTISEERRVVVEEHLKNCDDCLNFSVFLKEELGQVEKEAQTVADPFFYTRLMARIEKKTSEKSISLLRLLPKLAAAAVFLVAVAGGLSLGKLFSGDVPDYNLVMNEEIMFLDELKQESIESFFITTDNDDHEQN